MAGVKHGLALGGGGERGVSGACVLRELERQTGKQIRELFDMIAGTSTGAELAIGFGLGISAAKLVDFYVEHGPAIFARRLFHWEMLRAKYDIAVLEMHLDQAYGGRLFRECTIPVLATTIMNYGYRSEVLKSVTPKEGILPASQVAAASSAATPYFAPVEINGIRYIDGGFATNNPSVVCMTEAKKYGWMDNGNVFTLVHLACPAPPPAAESTSFGLLGVAKRVANMFIDSGSDAISHTAASFLGDNFVDLRLTLQRDGVSADRWPSREMDDASEANIQKLIECGVAEAPAAVAKIRALLQV